MTERPDPQPCAVVDPAPAPEGAADACNAAEALEALLRASWEAVRRLRELGDPRLADSLAAARLRLREDGIPALRRLLAGCSTTAPDGGGRAPDLDTCATADTASHDLAAE